VRIPSRRMWHAWVKCQSRAIPSPLLLRFLSYWLAGKCSCEIRRHGIQEHGQRVEIQSFGQQAVFQIWTGIFVSPKDGSRVTSLGTFASGGKHIKRAKAPSSI